MAIDKLSSKGTSLETNGRPSKHRFRVTAVSVPQSNLLKVCFNDNETFTYHAQWLHDARNDRNPSRAAEDAFTVHAADAFILNAHHSGNGAGATVHVNWADGTATDFPGVWLCVFAPIVAKSQHTNGPVESGSLKHGWTTESLTIPEVDWNDIFPTTEVSAAGHQDAMTVKITNMILYEGSSSIIKIVNAPDPDIVSERDKKGTLVTKILKHLFGQVFVHPRRAIDETFNITDNYGADKLRGAELHNYQVGQVLLPHCDHAHYDHPAQIQGLYCLEGESYNTFVSSLAVLNTMRHEAPDLVPYLSKSAMVVGRAAHFYDPPMFQATVEPAVTLEPGFPNDVKRIRWHPHLAGSIVTDFDHFSKARAAYQKFQEILRRPSHQLTLIFRPGDLYIWNNFRTLHGRESVISTPRTSVGQTVPEQVVSERYRSIQIRRLKALVGESWLVHVPNPQLYEMAKLLDVGET
ncbi:hypothetical protein F4780DRAFT_20945 [Xylariomycetidae sp. FL0641]|nr:hypothetical protein F4780DRAFT_20945 [Xylariomycetidae sp. FL0641]